LSAFTTEAKAGEKGKREQRNIVMMTEKTKNEKIDFIFMLKCYVDQTSVLSESLSHYRIFMISL
jgi:hypothetical protein